MKKLPAGANGETTALAGPLGRGFLSIRTKTRALHKFQISFLNNKNEPNAVRQQLFFLKLIRSKGVAA